MHRSILTLRLRFYRFRTSGCEFSRARRQGGTIAPEDRPVVNDSAPPAIEIRNLVRRFGSVTAVDGISLRVPRGSLFGFLGPNGAGKTTTVRMVTGLLRPDSGDALVLGRSILHDPVRVKRDIGVVPDDLALFDRLSFHEHLTLVGRVHGLSRGETESRAEDLLRLLDLHADRGILAVQGSTGMRKKLALAAALIHAPPVLFLDEPFEGIDPVAGLRVRDLLKQLAIRGTTIFLTSHILEIVERLADRVAVIVRGRVTVEGAVAELRRGGRTLEDVFVEAVGAPAAHTTPSWLAGDARRSESSCGE
jgi:ABC-2 type transport system ATP-binding protein